MLATTKRQKLRAKHRNWPEAEEHDEFFSGYITLDPLEVSRVWGRLSHDVFSLEVACYPNVFHHALISTLRGRKTNG